MPKDVIIRPFVIVILASYLCASFWPDCALAQTAECSYDRRAPSLASARSSFQEFDFACAEREVADLLKVTSLAAGTQADAHALLAAILFQTLPDNQNRRERVIEEFRRTFSLRPDWNSQLDVQSPAFRDLMTEAKRQVEQLRAKDKPSPSTESTAKPTPGLKTTKEDTKSGSSKKWILVAVGAAAVGVAVLALGGGGGSTSSGDLPDFPPHPGDGKR